MYTMLCMGGYNEQIFEKICEFSNIRLEGFIIDTSLSDEEKAITINKLSDYHIQEKKLEDVRELKPDLIFLCNYTKILETDLLNDYLFVNIHAGILPKWRGTSANSWAIINGEKEVGYSIHRVREELDGGEIYKVISVPLKENEKYGDVRYRLKDLLCAELETVFTGIIERSLPAIEQAGNEYVYTSKFRAGDGYIYNWNIESQYLMRLYRVMGYPYGSGIIIFIKDKKYEVLEMEEGNVGKSIGIAGAVIYKYADGSVLIKTKDTAVRIYKLRDCEGNIRMPGEILAIGNRL